VRIMSNMSLADLAKTVTYGYLGKREIPGDGKIWVPAGLILLLVGGDIVEF